MSTLAPVRVPVWPRRQQKAAQTSPNRAVGPPGLQQARLGFNNSASSGLSGQIVFRKTMP